MISLIVTAAGKGTRFGNPEGKLFVSYKGKPLLQHTLEAFKDIPDISECLITGYAGQIQAIQDLLTQMQLPIPTQVIEGGELRAQSVHNAVKRATQNWVLIHDGARPFVSEQVIHRVLAAKDTAKGVIPGIPETDTIKWVKDGVVEASLDRSQVMRIQTPQLFETATLLAGYEIDGWEAMTDESMSLEELEVPVKVVLGDAKNIKVTYPEDLT